MATIKAFVLASVLNRIERGEILHSFVVHPNDTKYVRNRGGEFEEIALTVERKKKSTGCRYGPKGGENRNGRYA